MCSWVTLPLAFFGILLSNPKKNARTNFPPYYYACICLWSDIFPLGTKVEGILRQSADVEEVDRRVQEYEQGILSIRLNNSLECS